MTVMTNICKLAFGLKLWQNVLPVGYYHSNVTPFLKSFEKQCLSQTIKPQQTPVFDNDDRAVQPLATALELLLQSRRLFLYSKLVVTGAFGPAPWRCQSQ